MRVSSLKNGSCLRVALTGGDGTDTSPFLVPYGNRNGGKIYVLGHKPMFKLQLSI